MVQKRVTHVDSETGEIIDGFVAFVVPKRINGFSGGWFAMAQDALSILKQFKRLEDFRVLMALLEQLDYENLITVSQAEIARDLGMKRENVNRAISHLIELEALFEGPRVGITRSYRLNPSFGWKGSAKNHVTAINELHKGRYQKEF